jgi:hypothetical protein
MVVEVKFDLPIVEEANLAIVGAGYEIVKKQVVREVRLGASNCGANHKRLNAFSDVQRNIFYICHFNNCVIQRQTLIRCLFLQTNKQSYPCGEHFLTEIKETGEIDKIVA